MGHDGIPASWDLGVALAEQPGLALVPSRLHDKVLVEGDFRCYRVGPDDVVVDEIYAIRIEVPWAFPRMLPCVFETGGRIPKTFHRNPDSLLCLGSPLAQILEFKDNPTVGAFIDRVIVPYFYSHAFHARHGRMPFGELAHGVTGLDHDLRRIFRLPREADGNEFLRLASLNRRHANKQECPCGSRRRLGRCHNLAVNRARRRLGRAGCRRQLAVLVAARRT